MRARPALGRANGVAPVSPSEPAKRTRTESTPPTEHVTIADRTLVGFAATVTFDTFGLSLPGASPSRQAAQQTSTRTSRHESFMISATGHGATTGVGTCVVVSVPLPSSPTEFSPQQYAAPL